MKSVFTRKKERKAILRICSFAEMFAVKVIFLKKHMIHINCYIRILYDPLHFLIWRKSKK